MGQLLTFFFIAKMSHIELNYAFLEFWSIFGEFHRKSLFLFQKKNIYLKEAQKFLKICPFQTC